MSEKNNNIFENDLLMRAILEGGQEEVPGRVWDAVSERLDKASDVKVRKPVKLWWRRAGMAVAAAAAVVAAVVLVERGEDTVEMVPRALQGDMIAVVEPEAAVTEDTEVEAERVVSQTSGAELLAYVPKVVTAKDDVIADNVVIDVVVEEVENNENSRNTISDESPDITAEKVTEMYADDFEDWEDETPVRQVKTSFVISGLTGSAGSKNPTASGPLKAPSVILAPTETGIREKENQTHYGIPVSMGAGVRFEFSPRWSLGVGLNYTNLSRTLQGTYTHVNEAGSIDDLVTSDIKNNQHYLGVPVNIYLNILNNNQVNFYTYAGGTVEKCLANKYHVLTGNIMHKKAVKGVQLSAAVGLGAEFMLTKHAGLYIDPSLRYYFDCDQPKSIRTAQPLTFGMELGLRFKL